MPPFLRVAAWLALPVLAGPAAFAAPTDDWVQQTELHRSDPGGAVQVARYGAPEADALGRGPDQRPALLVVAGLDARQELGRTIAAGVGAFLLEEHRDLLRMRTVYVVSDLSPTSRAGWETRRPRVDFGGRVLAQDRDGDRRSGEDGGEDLDGDGFVTWMRVLDPPARSGLSAGWIVDPDDARLMKEADADKGEIGRYAVLLEGTDDDGDGRWGEDGLGGTEGSGIDLDRDFPALWPALEDATGPWPLSQPETRALADWLLAHPNVVACLSLGRHDNLAKLPEVGEYDATKRVPLGIEKGDQLQYEELGELYRESTGITDAEPADRAGSFHHWAYAHLGLTSLSTPGWARADRVKKDDDGEEKDADREKEAPNEETPKAEASPAAPPVETIEIAGMEIELSAAGIQAAMAEMEKLTEAQQNAARESVMALSDAQRETFVRLMQGGEAEIGQDATGSAAEPAPASPRGESRSDDGKWLEAFDESGRPGFKDWTEVAHPQLGTVEVGGFVPGFRTRPAEAEAPEWIAKHHAFISELASRLPDLSVDAPEVEKVGEGLWRVSLRLHNDTPMPTRTAMGVKARHLHPTACVLDCDPDALLRGSKVQSVDRLLPGQHLDLEWLLFVPDGSTTTLQIRSAEYGNREFPLNFQGGTR